MPTHEWNPRAARLVKFWRKLCIYFTGFCPDRDMNGLRGSVLSTSKTLPAFDSVAKLYILLLFHANLDENGSAFDQLRSSEDFWSHCRYVRHLTHAKSCLCGPCFLLIGVRYSWLHFTHEQRSSFHSQTRFSLLLSYVQQCFHEQFIPWTILNIWSTPETEKQSKRYFLAAPAS